MSPITHVSLVGAIIARVYRPDGPSVDIVLPEMLSVYLEPINTPMTCSISEPTGPIKIPYRKYEPRSVIRAEPGFTPIVGYEYVGEGD